MKIKTNIRAGKRSGTVLSNSDLYGSAPDVVEVVVPVSTRCVGL
jgi:hypothetical protein